jgi:hypothetical protein
MKHLKVLGLAAVAALALMAMVGAGAASAAKVCSTSGAGEACTSGKVLASGTKLDATLKGGTVAELASSFDNIACRDSTVSGQITSGMTGTGDIESMTFGNCTDSFGNACTASTSASSSNKWPATTSATGSGNGTMTVSNVTGEFNCPTGACVYKTASATTTVTGGEPATITASKVGLTFESGSFGCTNAVWSATYTVTSPTSLWLF